MVILGIATWGVSVYGFMALFRGSPVIRLIKDADSQLVEHAAALFEHADEADELDGGTGVAELLNRFFWQSALALAAGLTEVGVVVWFIVGNSTNPLVWALIAKQGVSLILERRQRRLAENQLRMIRLLPRWFELWTRLSYGITGVCCLLLFLMLNELI